MALHDEVNTGGGDFEKCSAMWTLDEANILLASQAPRPGANQQPVGSSTGIAQAKQQTSQEHRPTYQHIVFLSGSSAFSKTS